MPEIIQPSFIDQYLQETVVTLDAGDPIGSPVVFLPDDVPVTFTVEMTQTQFTAVLSSLIFGAGILYPTDYQNVIWYLMRSVTYQMSLCDQIIENCFTSEGFQLALSQLLGDLGFGAGGGGTNETNSEIVGSEVWSAGSCTDNEKYGVAFEMVAYLDRASTDMLESLQDSTNELTTALDLVGNIPVLNVILSAFADSASELSSYIVNEIALSYASAYDLATQDEIACRVYEQMTDCSLTIGQLITGYESYISDILTLPSGDDFNEVVDWLFGLSSLANEMIVATLHWLVLQVYAHASDWFASPARGLIVAASYAESVPVPEECGGVSCYEWDFTIDAQGWQIWSTGSRPFGTYNSGVGWQCTQNNLSGNNDNRIYIENLSWAGTADFERIECDVIPTNGGSSRAGGTQVMNGTTLVQDHATTPQTVINSTLQTVGADFANTGNGLRVYFTTNTGATPDQDALTIVKVRIYYTNGSPEDGSAC